ncbi:hypothetical protein [Caldalkalibacillus salinus]|uniref:hypothetical protein n=1 Tax=Caldalkalibacillus salinus TaxID=2803787 RepID=UPI0019204F5E|nr:hypothetical protein [Caldalkalibacillus salinus]
MKMPKDEKAIIAGFRTMEQAEKAKQELSQLGVIDQRVDRMSLYTVTEFEKRPENPITGDYPGLANATFDQEMGRDQSVLANVQPSASGLSDGNPSDVGLDVVLSAVVSEKNFHRAQEIVRECGGQF